MNVADLASPKGEQPCCMETRIGLCEVESLDEGTFKHRATITTNMEKDTSEIPCEILLTLAMMPKNSTIFTTHDAMM
jgi:hypothetical protein